VTVVEADVLDTDFAPLLEAADGPEAARSSSGTSLFGLVAHPVHGLDAHALFAKCVFLLQKEVADRVCGRPGTKGHSRCPSCSRTVSRRASNSASLPALSPPRQGRFGAPLAHRRAAPLFPAADETGFRRFLRGAFAQRRKLLVRNLEMSGLPRERIEAAYAALGLARNARAEELPPTSFSPSMLK